MSAQLQIGELLAVGAALFWAVGVVLFKKAGEALPPLSMNLFKGLIGVALLTPTIPLFGESLIPEVSPSTWLLLVVSGVMGIAVADTLFFMSLDRLGAGMSAVVGTSYTPIIVGLSYLWLGERLTAVDTLGAALIVSALLIGSATRPPPGKTGRDLIVGSLLGVAGVATMGVSIVMIKERLNDLPVLWSTWVRLWAGTAGVVPLIALRSDRRALFAALLDRSQWRWAIPGSVAATYLAMICWIGGMKLADVSRAALLNQLSTIFIFVLATLFLREPLTWRRTLAVTAAVIGAALVMG